MEINFNTAEMDAVFARLTARLTDFTGVMQDIGDLMVASTLRNFEEGSDPDGVPWAPKSQATLDAYEARKEAVSVRPLIGPSRALSRNIFAQHDAKSVSWGSTQVYAGVMQFGAAKGAFGTTSRGSPVPWGNIPARPFIGVGPEDERAIIETIEDWLEQADGS